MKALIKLMVVAVVFACAGCLGLKVSASEKAVDPEYTVAAFVWPSCHDDPRWRPFFQGGTEGEWQSIRNAKPKFEGHWQPRIPLWGYEMDDDPKAVEKKIDAAVSHGVNCFIYDWYWFENKPFLESAINNGFLGARNNRKMKFYLMWANHDAKTTWNIERSHEKEVIWPGAVDLETFKVVVKRVIRKYFKQPNYCKIDGKPVFCIYDVENLINGLGGVDQAVAALAYFEGEVVKAGFPGLHIQITMRGKYLKDVSGVDGSNTVGIDTIEKLGVDSLTHYQWVHMAGVAKDYNAWAAKAIPVWSQMDEKFDIPYFPHVSIGWDNNARFKQRMGCVYQNVNPDNFKKALVKAKAYADARPEQPKLITINAWNEWVEGSYLEPDQRFGFGYLEAVRDVFVPKE